MGKKRQILAVDDNSISLATIEQELDWEFDVIPLNSGIRALQYLKKEEQKPDLILLDIQMAIKDGIETLKEIRQIKDCQDIPVIMLTSNANKKMVVESSKFKIYDYVLKPFKNRESCKRIDIVFHKVSEEKEKASFLHETRSLLEIEQGTKK